MIASLIFGVIIGFCAGVAAVIFAALWAMRKGLGV
jgi:F0F1-type ATP synthase assembly protein I